ncbi:FAD-binding oxidoreductase [Noviherbaspirillum saxi]|uniref:FAD-binding oxidoreductase n=1 Tax=Noviherbaspirillum saxi TaxID=2320863 RepID=A0A3A3FZD6_9BURK|nr:FAD-binding oxidoreductase [Noviherbaspirillum saxi]
MDNTLLDTLRGIVGPAGLLAGDELRARQKPQQLHAYALVRPASTAEVSAVLAACHAAGVAVVPQGGLTGLVHGADAQAHEVILSLERMNRLEPVDITQRVLVAEAGVILEQAQAAAEAAGLLFPVDLGARGSATLGGMVATNAGGNSVIRYGMMRNNVHGLEVVLADGTVLSSMNQLLKNNSGYDLKHLFIGSEGTLGVVTRVVLRLCEAPAGRCTALLALSDFDAVGKLLRRLDHAMAGTLSAFEVMWQDFYQVVTTPPAQARPPLPQDHAFYVLVEASGSSTDQADRFAQILSDAMEHGLVADATIAQSERECQALWALRDDVRQLGRFGPLAAYDISLRLADTATYVETVRTSIQARWPDAQLRAFGHLGDGNVHVAVHVPDMNTADRAELDGLVYTPLQALNGAVSAEHGIGIEKKAWLGLSRTPAELALMLLLKQSLDPKGVLNPGRVVDSRL